MLPAMALSAWLCSSVTFWFAAPLSVSGQDLLLCALFGIVQNAVGLVLYAIWSRKIPAAEATLIAGATGAAVGTVVATEVVAAEVISLAAARVAAGVAVETIRQAAPRIAAAVTIYLAGRELDARPETAGLCIEAGCDVGEALGGESL